MNSESEKIRLVVVSQKRGSGIRCVYLNNFRIAGAKPYASEDLPEKEWALSLSDIRSAGFVPADSPRPVEGGVREAAEKLRPFVRRDDDGNYFSPRDEYLEKIINFVLSAPAQPDPLSDMPTTDDVRGLLGPPQSSATVADHL